MTIEPVILVGAGGHAKVVADVLAQSSIPVAGCLCPRGSNQLPDTEWLGEDGDLESLRLRSLRLVHIAIGENALRRKLAEYFKGEGFRLVSVLSHHSTVSPKADIKPGAAIMPGAVINAYAQIGECAIINTSASVDHDCRVGAYAHVGPGCHLAGNVVVEDGTFLGTGASVIPDIHIGSWSIIGAGSVVVRSVPAAVTAVGVPARTMKHHS